MGYDEVALGDMIEPGVTVVAQNPPELGRRAAELLFSRLEGHEGPSRQIVLETQLIPRGSGEIRPPAAKRSRS